MNIRRMTTGLGIAAATAAMVIASAGAAQADAGSRQALNGLVTSGVITQTQLDAFTAEKNELKDSGMNCREATAQALIDLVAAGTLSQEEADAIQAAKGGSRRSSGGAASSGNDTPATAQGIRLQSAPAPAEATVAATGARDTATQTGTMQDRRQQGRGGRGGRGR